MKKIILITLFIPFAAKAQVELAAHIGGSLNIGTSNNFPGDIKKNNISPFGSLKVSYLINTVSVGVSADVFSIKQTTQTQIINKQTNKEETVDYGWKPYSPAINLSIFANKNFSVTQSSFIYAGASTGYTLSLSSTSGYLVNSDNYLIPEPTPAAKGSSSSFTLGVQFGYAYSLNKKLKIKAELAPRYLYSLNAFGEKDNGHTYNTIVIPLTAGISYSIN